MKIHLQVYVNGELRATSAEASIPSNSGAATLSAVVTDLKEGDILEYALKETNGWDDRRLNSSYVKVYGEIGHHAESYYKTEPR